MEPVRLTSRVTEVEVFRSGARVVRTAGLPDRAWPDEVTVDGLPLALEDGSVRVSIEGEPGADLPWPADVRVLLVLPEAGAPFETPQERELLAAGDEVQRLKVRLARLDREAARLDRIQPRLPEPFANRPPRPAPAAAWRGTIAWLERRREALLDERLAAVDELRLAEERLARLGRDQREERARRDARTDGVSKAVVVRLRGGRAPATASLRVEYQVPGAFWAPTYTVRVARDGRSARVAVRALVAQRSGEPWPGVALRLSTADRRSEAELPELASLRIGRRQEAPSRPAWRPLPEGYDQLFAGVDAALARKPELPRPEPQGTERRRGADAPEAAASRTEPPVARRPATVPAPAPVLQPLVAAAPTPPPAPPPAVAPAPQAVFAAPARVVPGAPGVGAGVSAALSGLMRQVASKSAERPAPQAFPDAEPEPQPLEREEEAGLPGPLEVGMGTLRYGELSLTSWEAPPGERGRLKRRPPVDRLPGLAAEERSAVARRLVAAESAAASIQAGLPQGTRPVAESAGAFDTRYVAEGPVDVPSDGRLHVVALLSREAPVRTLVVTVPREGAEAVRVAVLSNPLRVPLLEGPADVYLEDELLVTAPLRTVPAGGELTLGLGVEERLKVARNVRYAEEAHGMLGGGTTLDHQVTIELASRLPDPVEVEVRERVPVKEEADRAVDVAVVEVSPPWSDYDQAPASPLRGGKRWRLTLAAGETRTLSFRYRIRIDGKDELVGGNRREPA